MKSLNSQKRSTFGECMYDSSRGKLSKWCEALFEKIGCRKFALILEAPEIDENLPAPLSWDVELISTRKPIESSDFLKNGFRSHI